MVNTSGTNKALIIAALCFLGAALLQQREIDVVRNDVKDIREDIEIIKDFLVQTDESIHYTKNDVDCLSKNIYYEAGIEPAEGKYAVAQVTLNRLKTKRWGKSVCDVVYSKAQFSWTLKKKLEKPKGAFWEESQAIARNVLKRGVRVKPLQQSLMYHADYVNPNWVDRKQRITKIGAHIFYKNGRGQTFAVNG